ncbi:hypothetical protein PAT3040_02100 [Paenibacillus agaridevorans]|uniref:Uncharacterized protein n=1 Tax=Paenibacillus agaridevorans TaxID=171404 RepID=A0A2R5ELW6_9BACL|nr:hypothetical protein [Paenibacillus agaridevorans]GBG07547.1 hypothetical protein PAT3040_02100 [Paenibacillus agaridevorans]
MSKRYRITRSFQEPAEAQEITLEECKKYFAAKPDFVYKSVYTVKGPGATMSIDGDFFMWSHGGLEIPFRHYMGDLYVAVTNEAVVPKMVEIASELRADLTEG